MKVSLQNYFEVLKQEVLYKAQIKNIAPSDCYVLSLKIQEKTQKRISETTLKRIFGFAKTYYNPSTYTCNALAEYCGYESYNSFLSSKEKEGLEKNEYKSWSTVLEIAHKISRFRILSNKHRSGISYNSAIDRLQIKQIINDFTSNPCTACIIEAPAGGGKTIGLTKWIDQCLNKKPVEGQKDIYLFLETPHLLLASIYSFHATHWLGHLMGLDSNEQLHEFMETYKISAPGNFYLIIDDIASIGISEKEYCSIFTTLIDMVNYFSTYRWFKIILSTRPPIWNKNKYLIESNNNVRKQWCSDAYHIRGFNEPEIEQLSSNLKFKKHIDTQYNDKLFSLIKLPLYFQLYYQLKKDLEPKRFTTFDKFNLYRAYLEKYVLNGINLNKKMVLLNMLSKYVIFKRNTLCIELSTVVRLRSQYPKAYEELINSGIISPFSYNAGLRRISEIRFKSKTLGSYFIALRILEKNHNIFDGNLVQHINTTVYQHSIKTKLLLWLIILALENSKIEFLDHLEKANFIKLNETNIISFIINSIENILDEEATRKFSHKISSLKFLDLAPLNTNSYPI